MIQADTLKPGLKFVKFGDVVRLSKDRGAKGIPKNKITQNSNNHSKKEIISCRKKKHI
jgi:hypothetical protein